MVIPADAEEIEKLENINLWEEYRKKVIDGAIGINSFEQASAIIDEVEQEIMSDSFVAHARELILDKDIDNNFPMLTSQRNIEYREECYSEIDKWLEAYRSNDVAKLSELLISEQRRISVLNYKSMARSGMISDTKAEELISKVDQENTPYTPITGNSMGPETPPLFGNEGLVRLRMDYITDGELEPFEDCDDLKDILNKLRIVKAFIFLQKAIIQKRIVKSEQYQEVLKQYLASKSFAGEARTRALMEYIKMEVEFHREAIVKIGEIYMKIQKLEFNFLSKLAPKPEDAE